MSHFDTRMRCISTPNARIVDVYPTNYVAVGKIYSVDLHEEEDWCATCEYPMCEAEYCLEGCRIGERIIPIEYAKGHTIWLPYALFEPVTSTIISVLRSIKRNLRSIKRKRPVG